MNVIYQTTVKVAGGRNGHIRSEDGILDLQVRIPKEMGGVSGYTNPEQLFAGGYAACFDSALNLVMRNAGVKPTSPSVITATVSMGDNGQGGFQLAVKMAIHIPGVEEKLAKELVEKAHEVCPYSNATRGNIEVVLELV